MAFLGTLNRQQPSAPGRMRSIETPALTLVPQVAAHAEHMFAVLSDPAIYEYENEPPPSLDWLRTRFIALESRQSPDGQERWLNWVIQLPTPELIGYVQATVQADGSAGVAYILSSRFWGRGLGYVAVDAMLVELRETYRVHHFTAVFKRRNLRSRSLLERLGFSMAPLELHRKMDVEPDEWLMHSERHWP
jgi:ribosomal-protein-alanine N-acetyltransferase